MLSHSGSLFSLLVSAAMGLIPAASFKTISLEATLCHQKLLIYFSFQIL